MSFSADLWAQIEDIYARILGHPFVDGLCSGDLDDRAFAFYLVQDTHYLREFARVLSVCSARAPDQVSITLLAEHASEAIAVERALHGSLLADMGIGEADVATTPMAPTNLAYCSYLLASAYVGSFAEGLAAVLPCYWIYREVGNELLRRGSPHPLYVRWIETYGGESLDTVVNAVLNLVDRIGETLSPTDRAAATSRFITSARYEWMFWEMGYRREAWPV